MSTLPSDFVAALACPACRSRLATAAEGLECRGCGAGYAVEDGVPVLLAGAEGNGAQHRQAAFFDHDVAAEFEIERPRGTPRLYAWTIAEKFRLSLEALGPPAAGTTVLAICAGSGMDSEFLARSGMRVICCDISLGAARRAKERARRRGLEIVPIVADAERLPFPNRALDLAYVHDGLHHLERPLVALSEMARVARGAVSISEPARAAVTALAVRLGLALEWEEAGNRVTRLTLGELETELARAGFGVVGARRYALYYRHEPGRVSECLSRPVLFQLSQAAIRLANGAAGRWGNKLTVQAMRLPEAA